MSVTESTVLTTDARLREVCKELPASASSAIFIATAHSMVYDRLATSSLSDARLELIELYLAAHFAAITYPVTSFEGVAKVQESYQYKVEKGLNYTKYGQQAMVLDTTGTLRRSRLATINWLGMTEDEAALYLATK